ncbi:hypothetical protein [Roseomonas mucosa]|uniref:hypothetical protein n=1 Tax=Roseomonas mucosa TaxID=207340 RepID=UPI002247F1C3|nr:hypothetical protein [Roseomonas mucosa]UZO91804.1 Hypothetical protein RMP42_05373 [Roseomonas mucosa]
MTAEIHAKLDQILRNQERDEAIVRSLALMVETQNTHTEMLAKLLEAAGSESPEGQDLAELLQKMLEAIEAGNGMLAEIKAAIAGEEPPA